MRAMRPTISHDPIVVFDRARETLLERLDAMLAVCESKLDVAWTLADFAGRALDLDDCVIYLLDADGQSVSQYAAWGAKRCAERIFENRIRLKLGEGIVGTCAASGKPERVDDTRADGRYVLDDAARLSELAVPIADRGKLLGVLDTEHREANHYTDAHVQALCAIATRAARRLVALCKSRSERSV